jgi:YhcH/YjgK/YiaL family protein
MIVTDLVHAAEQIPDLPGLRAALSYLRQVDPAELSEGRYALDGEQLYAMVQRYRTLPNDAWKFEGHRRYIDVQYVVSGVEVIGWASSDLATIGPEYDGKETWLGAIDPGAVTPVLLRAGDLAVLFPEDAHAPKHSSASGPMDVVKIVVKVAIEE